MESPSWEKKVRNGELLGENLVNIVATLAITHKAPLIPEQMTQCAQAIISAARLCGDVGQTCNAVFDCVGSFSPPGLVIDLAVSAVDLCDAVMGNQTSKAMRVKQVKGWAKWKFGPNSTFSLALSN